MKFSAAASCPRAAGRARPDGLLLLGEGDLGDAGLVAEVVHEAVEVGVHLGGIESNGSERSCGRTKTVASARAGGGLVHIEIFAFAPLRGAI